MTLTIGPTRYSKKPSPLQFARYGNDQTAIVAYAEDGSPNLKLTVNLEATPGAWVPGPYQVWVKTWEENEGVEEAMIAAGLILAGGRRFEVPPHRVVAVLADLTPEAIAALDRARAGG